MSELSKIFKALDTNILQDIKGKIKLLEYASNLTNGVVDGSYSVYEFEGFSSVNKPYEFHITFVSDFIIDIEDIADTSVEFALSDTKNSLSNKSIFRKIFKAEENSVVASKYMYKIHLVSPMYYMGLNKSYEIFLDKRVPDIITEIINRYAALLDIKLDMKIDLNNAPIKEYTTRYNQSCLEFITMLCEQEGYSMVIDYSSNDTYTISLCELNEHVTVFNNSLEASYNISKEFSSSSFLEDFYDKDKPSLEMQTLKGSSMSSESLNDNTFTSQLRNDIKNYKLHDNISELNESLFKDLSRYTRNDSEHKYTQSFNIYGKSAELAMSDSILVSIHDEKANKETKVIVTEVKYYAKFENALDEFIQDLETKSLQFYTQFNSIPYDTIFKPKKITKEAKISGNLSAIVSNSNDNPNEYSNEIDVDNEGRVRVIFHFEENKATSTYLRLSNIYSGDNYGSQFIPRVNSEVLVSFINGNPNKPVVIASLHNGENKHADTLPNNKTKSFIRTTSYPAYPDKLGFNEIGFEDKRDAEVLNLKAQKDYRLHTQNSSYRHIDNNSKVNIVNDEEITIKNDHNKTIGNNSNRTIKANDIKTVENEEVHTVQEDKILKVNKDFNTIVKRDKKTYIEKDLVDSIKNVLHTYIEGDVTDKYLENFFIQVGLEMKVDISGSFHLDTTSVKEQASDISEIAASDGISLKCGANVLTINSAGIHFKTAFYNDNSANGGLDAPEVIKKGKGNVTKVYWSYGEEEIEISNISRHYADLNLHVETVGYSKGELVDVNIISKEKQFKFHPMIQENGKAKIINIFKGESLIFKEKE